MTLCVTSLTYSIRINGEPCGHITPTRGLRQGDPISLFFSCCVQKDYPPFSIKSLEVGQSMVLLHAHRVHGSPTFFFANDSIIFCRATSADCAHLEHILETYEKASSQQLNRDKTALFFNKNTILEVQEDIKHRFGAEVIRPHETYLGLPSLVSCSKRNTF